MVLPKPELAAWSVCSSVNYCLNYGISETGTRGVAAHVAVNYYLDYRTSETAKSKWIEDHYGELPLD